MELHYLEYRPDDYREPMELDEYDLKYLGEHKPDEVWYYYSVGNYDGLGQMIILKDGLYYLHDMGHCSCYSGCERIDLSVGYKTIDELVSKTSNDYYEEVLPLIQFINNRKG